MSTYKTIDDMQVTGKTVLVRCDFNVPMKDGAITDTTRIERSLSTLSELSKKGARVVVLSHFGRPGGHPVVEMSLRPIAVALGKAMNTNVAFASDCVGPVASSLIAKMKNGDLHSGGNHTAKSVKLFHLKDLSKTVQNKIKKKST